MAMDSHRLAFGIMANLPLFSATSGRRRMTNDGLACPRLQIQVRSSALHRCQGSKALLASWRKV